MPQLRKSPQATDPFPKPSFGLGLLWESGIGFLLCASLAVACVVVTGLSLQRQALQTVRDARLQLIMQEVREQLEGDLSIGLDLMESPRAQAALDAALVLDASLRAAEIFDPQGRSLFNSDRGLIGEPAPRDWLVAAQRESTASLWHSSAGLDSVVGLPIRGPFNEVLGQIALTAQPLPLPANTRILLALSALWLGLLALLANRLLAALKREARLVEPVFVNAADLILAAERQTQQQLLLLSEQSSVAPVAIASGHCVL